MTINCIIVDDEPIARDILRTYVAQVPYLNLIGECSDAFEAMQLSTGSRSTWSSSTSICPV